MHHDIAMATRWNSTRTAGQHKELHMINEAAPQVLQQADVDNDFRFE